jgi:hypothetical protein
MRLPASIRGRSSSCHITNNDRRPLNSSPPSSRRAPGTEPGRLKKQSGTRANRHLNNLRQIIMLGNQETALGEGGNEFSTKVNTYHLLGGA